MLYSLRNRFLIIFTCLLTIPFVILSLIIPAWFMSYIKDQTQQLTIEKMEQYSFYVESITAQAQDIGKQVLYNQTTQDWIKMEAEGSNVSKEEKLLMKNKLNTFLSSIRINNSYNMYISVFLNKDLIDLQNKEPYIADWYIDYLKNEQSFPKSHKEHKSSSGPYINSFIIPLFNINTLIESGIIKVNFPSSLFESAINNISVGNKGNAYLIDSQGSNVLHGKINTPNKVLSQALFKILNNPDQKGGLTETSYDKDNYFIFFQKLPIGNWVLISEVKESDLFSKVNHLKRNLLFISAMVFLLTIISSFLLSSNITGPLEKLTKGMSYIERGDFSDAKKYMSTIKSHDYEVDYLIKVFAHTIDQLKKLIETEYESNIRRKDAEYKALLLQINPHFLNNTLEIVGGLAAQGKNKEVMKISVYLGRMMRYSLDTKRNLAPLGEELNYIRSYTDILKLRYENNIIIKIEEDQNASQFPIIKFILQPLVENAVKYSFLEKNIAEIYISIQKVKDKVFIIVEDKGIGMSDEVIKNLPKHGQNNESNNVLESKGSSIGLKNVIGRLMIYYGQNFFYQIETKKGIGTKVILCIHLKEDDTDVEGNYY
ncbi:sensor histidine kinase [Lederbergia panacisoli]|uniref:sensor histidine kinase n=1 Tax=Lederbergia panacisoli TaxID=1255251 RepID=UPI00214B5E5D|nr:sensor histidine kinase [Lederbergia panacisoli]MCR2823044.1 histidine kinase [Lederbergia panacisoli]